MVNKKVEGKEVMVTSSEALRGQVIDLMDALKESLANRAAGVPRKPPVKVVEKGARPARGDSSRTVRPRRQEAVIAGARAVELTARSRVVQKVDGFDRRESIRCT
jgi:hypothetical protein